jgi:branched-subunit amino acid aminotransferase/4-amino-4-deoxychorismate lyase
MSIQLPLLTADEVFARLRKSEVPAIRKSYGAMYSSWFGGIVRDPQIMMIPIDDHGFHRGDAVFEAIKCIEGRIFALDRHLERMERSASRISLKLPRTLKELHEIAIETVRASELRDCLLRYYVSRGPGGFTTNPYDSLGAQVYLVITAFAPYSATKYESGVKVKMSEFTVKESFFATVKSCNYLPNVLMKKEAVDAGVDFTISRDEEGRLAEGSTENFAIINRDNEFIVPGFERTLKGITVSRMMELAESTIKTGLIKAVRNGSITVEDVAEAREAMMVGTTLDILPVTEFAGRKVADGQVGPVCREFRRRLEADMIHGPLVTLLPKGS